jgi:hypothetical protein
MIVSYCVSDMRRRRRSQLFIHMMDAMGRGEDQEEQKSESGMPTQAALGASEWFAGSHHGFGCNPSGSCPVAQAGADARDRLN